MFQDPILSNKDHISEQIQLWEDNNKIIYTDMEQFKIDKNKLINSMYDKKTQLEKEIIKNIQYKIIEIKKSLKNIEDNNNFILPKHIYLRYYNIYNVNVFSYIKSFESYKLVLLNELRNIKNEIRFYKKKHICTNQDTKEKIIELYNRKNGILEEFFELNKGFNLIDMMFQQEIRNINLYRKFWYVFLIQKIIHFIMKCCFCKKKK